MIYLRGLFLFTFILCSLSAWPSDEDELFAQYPNYDLLQTEVHQYNCLNKKVPQTFYYSAAISAHQLINNSADYTCFDESKYGKIDREDFPRLLLKKKMFALWSSSDPRFAPFKTKSPLYSDILFYKMKRLGAPVASSDQLAKLFFPLNWAITSNKSQPIGYALYPFIERETMRSYCPNQANRFESELLEVLNGLIGGDTEGLYLGVRTSDGPRKKDDFVLVRESLLKKIWFSLDSNGEQVFPEDENSSGETLSFYWPADTTNPWQKKNGQMMYTIYHPSELPGTYGASWPSSLSSRDKKLACIPMMQDEED